MHKEKSRNTSIGTPGAASLMIIFAVLCLAVFAILSLSTAMADARGADASHRAIEDYYAADSLAEQELANLRKESKTGEFSMSFPISDTRELDTVVSVTDDGYEIIEWQTKYIGDWSTDESLGVWSGD